MQPQGTTTRDAPRNSHARQCAAPSNYKFQGNLHHTFRTANQTVRSEDGATTQTPSESMRARSSGSVRSPLGRHKLTIPVVVPGDGDWRATPRFPNFMVRPQTQKAPQVSFCSLPFIFSPLLSSPLLSSPLLSSPLLSSSSPLLSSPLLSSPLLSSPLLSSPLLSVLPSFHPSFLSSCLVAFRLRAAFLPNVLPTFRCFSFFLPVCAMKQCSNNSARLLPSFFPLTTRLLSRCRISHCASKDLHHQFSADAPPTQRRKFPRLREPSPCQSSRIRNVSKHDLPNAKLSLCD